MFDDNYYTSTNRPEVPSDRYRRTDMFGSPTPYTRTDKDMFDNVHPPGDYQIENEFSAHIHGAPPDVPLYHWKQGGQPDPGPSR